MAYWDFLQMNPENIATARNTSWPSAIKQDWGAGWRPNPTNVAQGSRVGLGSYINQGINSLRGVFNPRSNVGGATTLMRKLALSPAGKFAGTAGRVAGLTNPVGAAAAATYLTPGIINKLTEREDPNITGMFGMNISDLENKAAAYDADNIPLQDWGSPMGPIPDADAGALFKEEQTPPGVFPETEDLIPPFMDEPSGIGEGYDKRGFRLPSIMKGLAALKNMIPNPLNPESKNYNPRLQGQMDALKERGMLGDIKWSEYPGYGAGKITGGPLEGQNLVSGFGTNDYNEMLQKRIDYFNRQKEKKGKLTDEQDRRLQVTIAELQTAGGAGAPKGPTTGGGYGGPPTSDWNPNISGPPTHIGAGPLHGAGPTGYTGGNRSPGHPSRRARGGRVGYKTGGRVGILSVF